MIEKYKSRAIRSQIRRILISDWDPIGVASEPMAQDEYDSYIGEVFELLVAHASTKHIEDYLHSVETVSMGMTDANGKALMPQEVRAAVVLQLQRMFQSQMQSVE